MTTIAFYINQYPLGEFLDVPGQPLVYKKLLQKAPLLCSLTNEQEQVSHLKELVFRDTGIEVTLPYGDTDVRHVSIYRAELPSQCTRCGDKILLSWQYYLYQRDCMWWLWWCERCAFLHEGLEPLFLVEQAMRQRGATQGV